LGAHHGEQVAGSGWESPPCHLVMAHGPAHTADTRPSRWVRCQLLLERPARPPTEGAAAKSLCNRRARQPAGGWVRHDHPEPLGIGPLQKRDSFDGM
jgi:hypothetical protein